MKKHAYLIIAHNEPWILQTLVCLVDDVRNDIFIAIDSHSEISSFKDVKTNKSRLTFIKQCDNRWGSIKQVETEYFLFESAYNSGCYSYYHLLSGQDLPIKTQDYIHKVCDSLQGKEFVGFAKDSSATRHDIERKTKYYYILQNHFKCTNIVEKIICRCIQDITILLHKMGGVKRKYPMKLKKGCNWVSITDSFCRYLLSQKDEVLRIFNHTFCPDEIFLQTVLYNSPFRDNIYDINDEFHSCRRMIDWMRGKPYVWQMEDYNKLMEDGDCFFARKFSSADKEIIEAILKNLK